MDNICTESLRSFANALRASQVLLFDGEGETFVALRVPLEQQDLRLLDVGLDRLLLEESRRAPPFIVFEPQHSLVVAALDRHNLYLVAVCETNVDEPKLAASIACVFEGVRDFDQVLVSARRQAAHLGLTPFASRQGIKRQGRTA
jgi:hypothetical protein